MYIIIQYMHVRQSLAPSSERVFFPDLSPESYLKYANTPGAYLYIPMRNYCITAVQSRVYGRTRDRVQLMIFQLNNSPRTGFRRCIPTATAANAIYHNNNTIILRVYVVRPRRAYTPRAATSSARPRFLLRIARPSMAWRWCSVRLQLRVSAACFTRIYCMILYRCVTEPLAHTYCG